MKKKFYFIITFCSLLLFTVGIFLYIKLSKEKMITISHTNLWWNIYDFNINNIKNNMEEITVNSENFIWWELKNNNISDPIYSSTLNSLVGDIRMCYLEITDDGSLYENNHINEILKYRDKDNISNNELKVLSSLMNNNSCLSRFQKYSTLLLSNDETINQNILEKITKINEFYNISLTKGIEKDITYDKLLYKKIMETVLLSDLSSWLKAEYYKFS